MKKHDPWIKIRKNIEDLKAFSTSLKDDWFHALTHHENKCYSKHYPIFFQTFTYAFLHVYVTIIIL